MKFNGYTLLVIVGGVLAIIAGWFYQDQLEQRDSTTADLQIPDNIDYYFTDMTYQVMTSSGDIDYQFSSPRLEHYQRGDTSFIQQPAVTIYRDDGTWIVNAASGQLLHETEILRLEKQVIMEKQGADALSLRSEKAIFEAETELVTFPGMVTVSSSDAEISAASATLDIKNSIYRFQQTRTIFSDETS